ncbi:hypothetical protein [Massilia sp. Root335]|uniref:hypothetical protein n=1 Tax=Massilia sp. Root335 TaxID=1736517 RepID=UPI0006F426AB|nr:hypothetical protein [Massilia sp. Root335]KQV33793.1 hypothetical protein ASC93_25465 [Massilia sp. Root335]
MNDYILFMHDDVVDAAIATDEQRWGQYMSGLRASGQFDGGSAIGKGMVFKKDDDAKPATTRVSGYLRVRAENAEAAQRFLIGNPNYEAGGTVEIRELPRT